MIPPPQKLPPLLSRDINRRVLSHVADKHAHPDLAEILRTAVRPLGAVDVFCPDWPTYHYVVASTRHVIFAFAIGTNTIAFRLDPEYYARALTTGASAYPAGGEDWVSFAPFRDNWPRPDFEFWARKAYVYARDMPE